MREIGRMLRPTGGSVIHDHCSAEQGVADDHMNVICIRGRTVGPGVTWDLVQTSSANRSVSVRSQGVKPLE